MNAKEMEARYAELRQAHTKGKITGGQFQEGVAQLRLQGADGTWHQIDPNSGGWLKWNGRAWDRAKAPAIPQEPPASPQASGQQLPQGLLPLLSLILKNTFRAFKRQLPKMVLFGLLGWLLHTFLLVYVNQGFDSSSLIGNFLATRGNSLSGTVIWMVISGFLFSWLSRKWSTRGKAVPKSPSLLAYFNEARELAIASLIAGAGVSVIIGAAVNQYANVALAAGFGALMLSQGRTVIALLIRSAWMSTFGLIQGKRALEFGMAAGQVAIVGFALGFVLNSALTATAARLPLGIALLAGALYLAWRQGKSPAPVLPLLFALVAAAYASHVGLVFAHDGGWVEAGGTFWDWLRSEGAAIAVAMGIGPAIGTMLGPSLVQMLRDMFNSTDWNNIDQGGDGDEGRQKPPEPDEKPGPTILDENGEALDTWRPGTEDQDGNSGKLGDVWHWGRWRSPQDARQEIAEEIQRHQRHDAKVRADTKAWSEGQWQKRVQQLKADEESVLNRQAEEEARAAAEKKARDHMIKSLRKKGAARPGALRDEVQQHIADENWEGLKDLYRNKLQEQIDTGVQDSKSEQRWATAMRVGEGISRVTLAASKGALMVIGGPAGLATTAGTMLAVGTISATQEGTESYVRGDSAGRVVAHSCLGWLSGLKDVAVGRFTNLPGTGTVTKIFLPATADAGEAYIKARIEVIEQESDLSPEQLERLRAQGKLSHWDSMKKAGGAFAVSGLSEAAGLKIDGMEKGMAQEGAKMVLSSVSGGLNSVAQGGKFAEGALQGLEGGIGSRIGSHMASGPVEAFQAEKAAQAETQAARARQASVEAEERLGAIVEEMEDVRRQPIPIDEQPEIIQQLEASRHKQVVTETDADVHQRRDGTVEIDQRQRIPTDGADEVMTKDYVNERKAIEQMRDPQSSRTAKQAPQDLQDAMVNTRNDKILGPGEAKTIDDVRDVLVEKGVVQPGDKIKFETYRTPGGEDGPIKVGADEDRRLVAIRKNPETGEEMKVEIDRRHYEKAAEKNLFDQLVRLEGSEEALTSLPEYQRNLAEMQHLKEAGYTDDEIKYKAMGKTHNVRYTDKYDIESGMDYTDQAPKFVNGKPVKIQTTPHVRVAEGDPPGDFDADEYFRERRVMHPDADGRLRDPHGLGAQFKAKVDDAATQPEAIAQAQKLIPKYIDMRKAYREMGYEPPPLNPRDESAMKAIMEAPVGAGATPEAMEHFDNQARALGYEDGRDMVGKIAQSPEHLKFSRPTETPGAGPRVDHDLDAGTTATVARSVVRPDTTTEEPVIVEPEPVSPSMVPPASDLGVEPAPSAPMGAPREFPAAPAGEPPSMPAGPTAPTETPQTAATQPAPEEAAAEPILHAEPVSPLEPVAPAEKAAPAEPVSRAEPGAPAEKAAPVQPVSRAEPGAPAEKAAPAQPVSHAEPSAPAEKAGFGAKEAGYGGKEGGYGAKEGFTREETAPEEFQREELTWEEIAREREEIAQEREKLAREREEIARLEEELRSWKDLKDKK